MIEYVKIPAPLPSSLIVHPCEPVGVGNSVHSLAKAYLDNTACIGMYKGVVKSIEGYNNRVKELAEPGGVK